MKRTFLKNTNPVSGSMGTGKEYIEAQIIQDGEIQILEIDLYGTDGELEVRHFLKEQDFDTLFMKDMDFESKTYHQGEWSKMRLQTVLARGNIYWSYWKNYEPNYSSEAGKNLETYFGRKITEPVWEIKHTEEQIADQQKWNRYRRKEERIDALMGAVEPVTEEADFRKWIRGVFPGAYIFAETKQQKSGYQCRCAACGKNFILKGKPKHNEWISCKKCGINAQVKTRVQQVKEEKNILVAQQYNGDTWVLRHFRFRAVSSVSGKNKRAKTDIQHMERIRMFLSQRKKTKIYYGVYREYDQDRIGRVEIGSTELKQDWADTKGGMVIDHKFLMYPGRLEEVETSQELKGMLVAGARSGKTMDYNMLVRCWWKHPYIEYLIKGRYYRLADEIISSYGYWSCPYELMDIAADNIPELLRLERQRANRLRDMDGGIHALEFLQIEERDGIRISQENLEFVEKHKIDMGKLELYRTRLGINRALNYFRRQMERNHMSFRRFQQYYHDYLNMAEERGADLTDDIIRVNARAIEYHMAYLEEKNRKQDEKNVRRLREKFPNIAKDYEENRRKMEWENEQYVILVPKDVQDIVAEGRSLHHCVAASDDYFRKMNDHKSFILFLRRKEEPEVPYYTLEVEGTTIKQRYAAYDRTPDVEKVDRALGEWKKEMIKREKKEQRENREALCRQVTEMVQQEAV